MCMLVCVGVCICMERGLVVGGIVSTSKRNKIVNDDTKGIIPKLNTGKMVIIL